MNFEDSESMGLNKESDVVEATRQLQEKYLNYEVIGNKEIERILQVGEINNIDTIENLISVHPHSDLTDVGELNLGDSHHDQVLGGEVLLDNPAKKLLVIIKPDSGSGKGTLDGGKTVKIKDPSRSAAMERFVWILAQKLDKFNKNSKRNFTDFFLPSVVRDDLSIGNSSVRPFFFGNALDELEDGKADENFFENQDLMELVAFFDGLIGNLDRKEGNILMGDEINNQNVDSLSQTREFKLIDHTLILVPKEIASQYYFRGPRLSVGYDNKKVKPMSIHKALPVDYVDILQALLDDTNWNELKAELDGVLTEEELGLFRERAEDFYDKKYFI